MTLCRASEMSSEVTLVRNSSYMNNRKVERVPERGVDSGRALTATHRLGEEPGALGVPAGQHRNKVIDLRHR